MAEVANRGNEICPITRAIAPTVSSTRLVFPLRPILRLQSHRTHEQTSNIAQASGAVQLKSFTIRRRVALTHDPRYS